MAVTKPVAFDHVQVRVVCYTPTQISVNVLDYVVRSPVITFGATLQEMATAISATLGPDYKAWMPSVARYRGVSVQDLTNPVSVPYVSFANDGPGTNGATLAPTQTTGIIQKKTLSGGRANRGRIYAGFPSQANLTATGGMSAGGLGLLANIQDAIDTSQTIVGAGGTTNLDLVVWHRGGAFNYTLVNQLVALGEWATQRRRGQFGRINLPPF
jgi:hypothetical protein